MDHCFGFGFLNRLKDMFAIAERPFNEGRTRIDGGPVTLRQIIENGYRVIAVKEFFNAN